VQILDNVIANNKYVEGSGGGIALFYAGSVILKGNVISGNTTGFEGAGIAGLSGGRAEYLAYLVPGILMIAIATGSQMTAIAISMDMTEGIIARFRTMSISRTAVLAGHVMSSMLQTLASVVVTIGVAVLMGFRPGADALDWLGAIGLVTLVSLAITWLSVGMGLVTKTVESASNLPMPLMLLPFLGSGFVPTDTLPAGIRWFADIQPFTPIMETLRALLAGTDPGSAAPIAIAWCLVIAAAGYVWARMLYERDPSPK
jgi:ABC-2 type transport system permease protein